MIAQSPLPLVVVDNAGQRLIAFDTQATSLRLSIGPAVERKGGLFGGKPPPAQDIVLDPDDVNALIQCALAWAYANSRYANEKRR
jgi:hypothetical protein